MCILLLGACASTPLPPSAQATSTALLMPTPTPYVPPPTPIPPPLGPVPQHCPVSNPTPHMSLPGLGPVIGASPVWADWPGGPVIAHLSPTKNEPSTYLAPYGWAILKTIWEVGPNYTHPVTVRGHDLFDHTPLLFQFDDTPVADAASEPSSVRCWRGMGRMGERFRRAQGRMLCRGGVMADRPLVGHVCCRGITTVPSALNQLLSGDQVHQEIDFH